MTSATLAQADLFGDLEQVHAGPARRQLRLPWGFLLGDADRPPLLDHSQRYHRPHETPGLTRVGCPGWRGAFVIAVPTSLISGIGRDGELRLRDRFHSRRTAHELRGQGDSCRPCFKV